jgi:GR25 family glycosyltransferase involved in LPS biosynthesis
MLNYLTNVFVINHDAGRGRLKRVSRRLAAMGISFRRFRAVTAGAVADASKVPFVSPGHWACPRSHRALLKKIYDDGIDRALILEDDVVFRDDLRQWRAGACGRKSPLCAGTCFTWGCTWLRPQNAPAKTWAW